MKQAVDIITNLRMSDVARGKQSNVVQECIELAREVLIHDSNIKGSDSYRDARWAFLRAAEFIQATRHFRKDISKAFTDMVEGK